MHYVLGEMVDFSSRAPHMMIVDIQRNAITMTCQELALALDGAQWKSMKLKRSYRLNLDKLHRDLWESRPPVETYKGRSKICRDM